MKLSIIIPAHNEEATIRQVLDKVVKVDIGQWEKEVIVVNDGSTDGTKNILEAVSPKINGRQEMGIVDFVVIHHSNNLGKGAAIQSGLKKATGDYVIIQDADLEYDPSDIPNLLSNLSEGSPLARGEPSAVAVFGKRGYKAYPERGFHYVIGAWVLTAFYNLLFHQRLTDLYTGYKLIPTGIFKSLDIQSKGFEFEAEVACKLAKRGVIIKEIPIYYQPRNKNQGKHIRFIDAVKGFKKILDLRFTPLNNLLRKLN